MKKQTKRIFKYLIEFLIVVSGVFLGVYASEIQSQKKITKEKEKSISYIIEELSNNKTSLKKSIKYHQLIKIESDSIGEIFNQEDLFKNYIGNKIFRHDQIKGWEGIKIANLESTAFEAAKISGIIKEYDIEFIQKISKIYNKQEAYLKFANSILTKMININSSSKVADAFGAIELMGYDLLQFEESILKDMEKIKY